MYLARAAECRAQADSASLPNVKERCLRAEEAWNQMAARLERHEKLRAETAAEKGAEPLSLSAMKLLQE